MNDQAPPANNQGESPLFCAQPAAAPPLVPLAVAQRIHKKCEQFEDAWSGPARPQLSDFLLDVHEPERTWLLAELLSLELELRQGAGEQPTEAEYLELFPREGDRTVIAAAFRRCAELVSEAEWELPSAAGAIAATQVVGPDGEGRVAHVRTGSSTAVPTAPKIEGYEILGVLGRGGMGVVYKARHLRLKRLVALKLILAGDHAGGEHLARFRTEAEMVARLQHPNIVQIFDIGEQGGHPYIAFEFIEGQTLADLVGREPQPPRVAAELLEALARAMHYAHLQGIVHRDLKPGQRAAAGSRGSRVNAAGRGSRVKSRGPDGSSSCPRPSSLDPSPQDHRLWPGQGPGRQSGAYLDRHHSRNAAVYVARAGRGPTRHRTRPGATKRRVLWPTICGGS